MTMHIFSFVFPVTASWNQTPRKYSILSLICLPLAAPLLLPQPSGEVEPCATCPHGITCGFHHEASVGTGGLGCETAIHDEDERFHVTLALHIGRERSRWLHADGIAFKHNVVLAGHRPSHGKAITEGGAQLRVWPRVVRHDSWKPFQKQRYTLSEQWPCGVT